MLAIIPAISRYGRVLGKSKDRVDAKIRFHINAQWIVCVNGISALLAQL
jgi:hypothetical protein